MKKLAKKSTTARSTRGTESLWWPRSFEHLPLIAFDDVRIGEEVASKGDFDLTSAGGHCERKKGTLLWPFNWQASLPPWKTKDLAYTFLNCALAIKM